MRRIVFLLWFLPVTVNAQINRSATELAKENIQEYITEKIFNGRQYQPVSYGELKPRKEENPDVVWSIEHKFQITETQTYADKKILAQKPHKFMFYLDRKMKVLRAETFYSD
jgi:regulatory protein YycI of two-component signal transduction system YycFG